MLERRLLQRRVSPSIALRFGMALCCLVAGLGAVEVSALPEPDPIDRRRDAPRPATHRGAAPTSLAVPRLERPPAIADFVGMHPTPEVQAQYARLGDFVQRAPSDGAPAHQATEVYLGYDDTHLHAIFVAHDSNPDAIRARMSRREDIGNDDLVSLTLDTDGDRQRGYDFSANPFGIQRDGLWTEGREADFSFDTLWRSEGIVTDGGYVVVMSIPFKSLRFPRRDEQTWNVVFWRWVPRGSAEESTWPHVSSRVEGILNQAGEITGLAGISPGRNLRVIPYGTFRSTRTLDAGQPGLDFASEPANGKAGLDAKVVIKDALVLDATFNPDFSQIESDQPQNTVNQRFEVFFPEKRPFFLENANYFETPLNLLFTRRIADPQFGARATGKFGGWAIGALAVDDRVPGEQDIGAPDSAPRSRNGVLRVSRDIGTQSNLGALFVERTDGGATNRVSGIDGRVKINANWVTSFQAVASETRTADGATVSGPAYFARLRRDGRQFDYDLQVRDIDENFRAANGFLPRVGIREITQQASYRFRPERPVLIAHGPSFRLEEVRDRDGDLLERNFNPWYGFNLTGQTEAGIYRWQQALRLRPVDYPVLAADRTYDIGNFGVWFNTRILSAIEFNMFAGSGTSMNFVPAAGREPEEAAQTEGNVTLAYRPADEVRISARWLFQSLSERLTAARIFRSDIVRGRLDWQFSRELSLRVIVQYESLATDPTFTRLVERHGVNADVLATYLVNPWTSLFVGYNGNYRELEPGRFAASDAFASSRFVNDARQFFVKASYLFSY